MWQARRCSHRGSPCSGNTSGSSGGGRLRGTAGHRQQDLWLAVALAALASMHAQSAGAQNPTNTMQRYYLNSTDPLAICNDGSSGVYYFSPGSGRSTARWVIRFQGGGWCSDGPSCQTRAAQFPYWMSSDTLPETISDTATAPGIPNILAQPGGILSTDGSRNPAFVDWNHVYIWYCTSDSSLGDIEAGLIRGTEQWQFRGRRIVAAVMDQLLAKQGLASAVDVLITGDSAGGVSALNNADFMLQRVKARLPSLRRWKVYADAGWFLDLPSFTDPAQRPMRAIAQALQLGYNATFDATCISQLEPGQAWACFFAQYWWDRFPLPLFVGEYLYDSANLAFDYARGPADADAFRAAMMTSLEGVANATELVVSGAPVPTAAAAGGGGTAEVALASAAAAAPVRRLAAAARRLPGRRQLAATAAPVTPGQLLNGLGAGQPPSVFSQACRLHEVIDGDTFFAARVGDTYLSRAVPLWFLNNTRYEELDSYPMVRSNDECTALPSSGQPIRAASETAPAPLPTAPAASLGLVPADSLPSIAPGPATTGSDSSPPAGSLNMGGPAARSPPAGGPSAGGQPAAGPAPAPRAGSGAPISIQGSATGPAPAVAPAPALQQAAVMTHTGGAGGLLLLAGAAAAAAAAL